MPLPLHLGMSIDLLLSLSRVSVFRRSVAVKVSSVSYLETIFYRFSRNKEGKEKMFLKR